jgi:hypothetical protein
MSSRTTSTAAAALLLAFAPLAVPDIAAATTATAAPEQPADGATAVTPEQPTDDPTAAPEQPTDDATGAPEQPIDDAATTPEPGASAPGDAPAAPHPETPDEAEPAPTPPATPGTPKTPAPTATTDEVTPNETLVDMYVEGIPSVIGEPGKYFEQSIFNVKNSSSFTIPSRSLDYHWTITGPGHFPTRKRPYSVANSGTANVVGCTYPNPKQTDCYKANPQSLSSSTYANYNHNRVPVQVDDTALPGDVVTVNGWFEPNASMDYVNTNTRTTTSWQIRIPLTAAVIDEPGTAVGPKPTVTGTGVPDGTVDVTVGDQPMVTVPVADDGTWTLTVTEALPTGPAAVSAVQHRNGFTADQASATLEIDADAPTPPIVDDPGTLLDPTGPITGRAEAGSIVVVRDPDGNELGRGEASDTGDFSVRLDKPLPEGANDLEVVAADRVGNESDATSATAVVPDTAAPDAPVVERQDLPTPAGPVVGHAEPGSTVIVRDTDGTELGRGEATASGDFSVELTAPLTEGDHDVEVVAQDEDGNESDPTAVTVTAPDVTAPEPPISTTPEFLADGTGPFTGSAERGATVIVRDADGTELGRAEAGADGQFTIVLDEPLPDGHHDLELVAEDASGNVSDPTPITVEVDEEAPNPPVVTGPTDLSDGTGPITGTAEPGSTVIIRDENGTELGRGQANDDGDFSIVLDESLADGDHELEVVAEDKVGHVSTPTPVTVDVDTQAPEPPVVTNPSDLSNGTGPITGTAEPGSTVIIRDENGTELGRGTANDDGDFTIVLDEPLTDGDHELELIAKDKVGNESDPTETTVSVDTEAPKAPVLEAFDDIVDGTGVVRGTAEPGSTVVIRDADGREIGRGAADAQGHFAFRTTVPLEPGAHLLAVVAVDRVGNESPGSSMLVTLVPEQEGDTALPEITTPEVPLPSTVAPPIGTGTVPATGTSDQRPTRSTGHATSATADELAFTGVELGGWLAAALTALGLGAFLRLLGRRRRRDDVQH